MRRDPGPKPQTRGREACCQRLTEVELTDKVEVAPSATGRQAESTASHEDSLSLGSCVARLLRAIDSYEPAHWSRALPRYKQKQHVYLKNFRDIGKS
eukprot:6467757-Amphidinium_carterae.1